MNNIDYIFKQVKSKYQDNNGVTDLAMKMSEDLKISYPHCWRMLRNEKFNFTRNIVDKINVAFPDWDWNKALNKEKGE